MTLQPQEEYQVDAVTQIQQQIGCKLIRQRVNSLTFQLPKPLTISQYFSIQRITGATHGEITCNKINEMHTVTVTIPISL